MKVGTSVAVGFVMAGFVIAVMGNSTQALIAGPWSGTIPALPVQSEAKSCELDLSDELFGGVKEACNGNQIDRSRCCPVMASWLYAAHARKAMEAPPPIPSSPYLMSSSIDMPVLPDDSQNCANTLQKALTERGVIVPHPNASCDAIICFCGIRLHQLASLNCVSASKRGSNSIAMKTLEKNCVNPSYQGCTQCLKTLRKLDGRNETGGISEERTGSIYRRDCELTGLTWLLAQNKTAYIPTVSAVLRAIMYSERHDECSPDGENMPLAVDSVEIQHSSAAAPSIAAALFTVVVPATFTFMFLL